MIFDCDGVLVDSEPITNRELAADLSSHGLPMMPDECLDQFGGGTIRSVYDRARALGAALADDWTERFYDRICAALDREVTAIPGATAAVAAIDAAGAVTAIGSNGPMRKMDITLGRAGLADRFAGRIFSAHDIGIAKPDPGFYAHIAAVLGVTRADTVVVEDSASGVKSATGAGIRCLGYAAATPAARLRTHGAEIFTDMRALPALLGLEPNR